MCRAGWFKQQQSVALLLQQPLQEQQQQLPANAAYAVLTAVAGL
jgi:hypothetical protein